VRLKVQTCLWVAIFAFRLATNISFAQDSTTGALSGTVLDPQNRLVVGAKITVVNEATGAAKDAISTDDGYQIPSLMPGTYRVEATAVGFAKSVAKRLTVSVGQLAVYDIHLQLGSESTVVEVKSDIAIIQPEQTQQANVINDRQVENLPNVNRLFTESVYTLPGVVNSFAPTLQNPGVGTAYQSSGFSIGGSNGRSNLVTIDGGENDYGSGALRVSHVPIDSIKEFQVNRNAFEAEFGFTVGTAINMITKGGTNQYHGSAAAYYRGRPTDAEKYFDKLVDPGHKPFEQSAIFSGTFGGPIRKNRLFFFTAPEYQKLDSATVRNLAARQDFQPVSSQQNGYNPATGKCPNQNTKQQQVTQFCYLTQLANVGGSLGMLGAGLLAHPIFGDPFNNPTLKALVTPNDGTFNGIPVSPVGSGVKGLPGFSTPRGRYFNWVTRLDYIPSSKDALSLRFGMMKESDNVRPQPPYSAIQHQSDYTLTGSWIRTAGPNIDNTLHVQAVPRNAATVEALSPYGSEIDLGNQIQLGTPYAYPYFAYWKRFQFDDGLSWVKGPHRFKFGVSWRPDLYSVREDIWLGGQWQFTDGAVPIMDIVGAIYGESVAQELTLFNRSQGYPDYGPPATNLTAVQAYLAGRPKLLLQADPKSNSQWDAWSHALGIYAQDSWRVSPRLSVNYGLRLDYIRDAAPVPHAVWASPRLGIAWSPGADQKTVIRAGGGIFVAPSAFMVAFYSNILGTSGNYINQNAVVYGLPSPPFPSILAAWALQTSKATTTQPNPPFTNADLASLGIVIAPPGPMAFGNFIYTIVPDFKAAYSIQSSLSIARELKRNLSVELGYLMYRSVHVQQSTEVNFVRTALINAFVGPGYTARPGKTVGEPNSSIFQNNAATSNGNGIYNGATVSLTRRFDAGLQFQANYTFSRAIDDTSDYSSLSTPFRPDLRNLERSLSYFDIRHNFAANAVYTTPSRVFGSGIVSRLLSDITISPIFYARSGGPFSLLVPGLDNKTIGHNANARPWFAGRNTGIGANFFSWDLRISKRVPIGEGRWLEGIVQAQNLLNRTNFAAVNNNFPVDANYPLPGGGTLQEGPFNVKGFAPTSASQLSMPLAFTSTYPARQISLALRFNF
jgi:hypothetical protein